MPTSFRPSIAALGVGAAVAVAAAVPAAGAIAATHRAPSSHHSVSHTKHVTVKGLIAAHHGRHLTVFAKKFTAGAATRHNKRVAVTFARTARMHAHHTVGNRIHLVGTARVSGSQVTLTRTDDETIVPAPASLIVGTIDSIDGGILTVAQQNRDDGEHQSGGDRHDGDGNDNDNARPAEHSPGGPGDGGPGSGGRGHLVVVDDSNAVITVDGSTDNPLAAGDTVAVLGETVNDTVVAADVFGFTSAPAFLRGDITAINGDSVSLGDDNHDGDQGGDDQGDGNHGDDVAAATPADHGGDGGDGGSDDAAVTVSLANLPLALNGSLGATTSDLAVGDKLILLGVVDPTSATFTPEVGFAFNGHDQKPCGHNDDQQGDDD